MVPVSCKLCSSLGAKTKFWTLDGRKTHAQLHVSQLGYILDDGEHMSVKQVFANCFPSEDFDKPEEIEKSRSMLMEICQRVIKTNKNESNSIECQVCKSNVGYTIYHGKHQVTYSILRHASFHSTKKPFACRQCEEESATSSDIIRHIKRVHKIDSPVRGVNFCENWSACFDEIKKSLAKCYGIVLDQTWSTEIQTPPSELSMQRRMILSKLVKSVDASKRIRCNQCRKEIHARSRYHLEHHVHFHLDRRIFKCGMCDVSLSHQSHIVNHLAKKHGVPPKGKYMDRSDEHHEEIVDWMKKCFGKKTIK